MILVVTFCAYKYPRKLAQCWLSLLANVYQAQSLLPSYPPSTTTTTTTAAAAAGTVTTTAATTELGDVDKANTFSLPTTQSPVLLHSSPFSTTTPPDLERLALRQELEETRCKLNAVSNLALYAFSVPRTNF
ncbi:unnamed protein product [Hydatigera taeniaeformis]|uniref:Uncharacterized protein n=1 Tax=Hydatigena taeniaeformis TaxID=6205 RepID=A0A0R3WXA4_HYDTA|nr:unnamed protein product [Hydatigera taeniaeformis]